MQLERALFALYLIKLMHLKKKKHKHLKLQIEKGKKYACTPTISSKSLCQLPERRTCVALGSLCPPSPMPLLITLLVIVVRVNRGRTHYTSINEKANVWLQGLLR